MIGIGLRAREPRDTAPPGFQLFPGYGMVPSAAQRGGGMVLDRPRLALPYAGCVRSSSEFTKSARTRRAGSNFLRGMVWSMVHNPAQDHTPRRAALNEQLAQLRHTCARADVGLTLNLRCPYTQAALAQFCRSATWRVEWGRRGLPEASRRTRPLVGNQGLQACRAKNKYCGSRCRSSGSLGALLSSPALEAWM